MSLLAEETIAGPGGPLPRSLPLSPPPESRSPAKPRDPGARRRAGQVPAPARPRAGDLGLVKVAAEKGLSGVEGWFIPSQPSPVLWGQPRVLWGRCNQLLGLEVWGVGLEGINSWSFFFSPKERESYLCYWQRMYGRSFLFLLEKPPLFGVFSAFLPVCEALGTGCHRLFLSQGGLHGQDFMFSWGTYSPLAPPQHFIAHSILNNLSKCLPHVICREERPCKGPV